MQETKFRPGRTSEYRKNSIWKYFSTRIKVGQQRSINRSFIWKLPLWNPGTASRNERETSSTFQQQGKLIDRAWLRSLEKLQKTNIQLKGNSTAASSLVYVSFLLDVDAFKFLKLEQAGSFVAFLIFLVLSVDRSPVVVNRRFKRTPCRRNVAKTLMEDQCIYAVY